MTEDKLICQQTLPHERFQTKLPNKGFHERTSRQELPDKNYQQRHLLSNWVFGGVYSKHKSQGYHTNHNKEKYLVYPNNHLAPHRTLKCNPAVSAAQSTKKNKYCKIKGLPPNRSLIGSAWSVLKSFPRSGSEGGRWRRSW
jgi:hypothetical protein